MATFEVKNYDWQPHQDEHLRTIAKDKDISWNDATKIFGVSAGCIRNRVKLLNIEWIGKTNTGIKNPMYGKKRQDFKANHWTKTKPDMQDGHKNHQWKGGFNHNDGYRLVLVGKKKYVPEHRLVVEQKLSRKLKKGEVVHHIDGDRSNNHPDNLIVFESQSAHLKQHWLEGSIR
jgi:hypothetical protein